MEEQKWDHVVTMEETDKLKRKFHVTFNSDGVQEALKKALPVVKKHATIKGFRKGKAPDKLVMKTYYAQVEGVAMEMLANAGFMRGCMENNIQPLGNPKCLDPLVHKDGSFTCSMEVDIYPIINLNGYIGLLLEKPTIDEESIRQQIIYSIGNQHIQEIELEEVEDGVIAYLDYNVKKDKQQTANGEDYPCSISKEQPRPFGNNLIGKKTGDEVSEDLGEMVVDIKIKKIVKNHIPNEEELKGMVDLEPLIQSELQKEIEKQKRQHLEERVVDKLIELHDFDIPEDWIEGEKQYILQQFGVKDLTEEVLDKVVYMAERNVRRSFLIDKIYNTEKSLEITEKELNEVIDREAKEQGLDSKQIKKDIIEKNLLDGVFGMIKEKKVMDFLISNAQIEEQQDTGMPDSPF